MVTPIAESGRSYLLDRPPLEIAVCEVRYPRVADVVTMSQGLALRDEIADGWDRSPFTSVESATAHELTVVLGPEGPVEQRSAVSGVRLVGLEGFSATVLPELTTVQVQKYVRWSATLRPVLEATLGAVGQLLMPSARARVGLRYVNRFTDPDATEPGAWGERIEPSLAGPLAGGAFTGQVTATRHQVELDLGEGVAATIRHGCVAEPGPRSRFSYLLDIDVYDGGTQRFDAVEVVDVAEGLNRAAAELFRRAMRQEFAAALGLHEVPTGEGSAGT